MSRINKERIKSIMIMVMLVAILTQVGILWSNNQSFPTSFFSAIFGTETSVLSDDMARDSLFNPFKMVVSNGNASYWVIGEDDEIFTQLWIESKTYLKEIADGNLDIAEITTDWGNISSKSGFAIEFKTVIKPSLLKWFLNVKDISTNMPSALKVMVVPNGSDENKNDIYIYNEDAKIFKCTKINNKDRVKTFKSIIASCADKKDVYREYTSMRDSKLETKMNADPDVLYVIGLPKTWGYSIATCDIPTKMQDVDTLSQNILGNEKDRYTVSIYENGTIQLSTEYNLYKSYNDGLLEYNSLAGDNSVGKGSLSDAVMNAYKMVERINKITNEKAKLYLSGIDDSLQGFYRIKFDYEINGMPVYINYKSEYFAEDSIKNAITFDVNSQQVLNCIWLIRDFNQGTKTLYNDHFFDIMANSGSVYSDLSISDLFTGYKINNQSKSTLKPLMIIEKKDLSVQTVLMNAGK